MKALVIYESMFGNTATIARAIANGLGETMEVDLCAVQDRPRDPVDVALIVAGGPTHAFSMSRTATRVDAVSQGATVGKVDYGLREWLQGVSGDEDHPLATFDTRVTKVRHLPGSAANSAARAGHKRGFSLAASPESFYVTDVAGPLVDGEVQRAMAWGRHLSALVGASSATRD